MQIPVLWSSLPHYKYLTLLGSRGVTETWLHPKARRVPSTSGHGILAGGGERWMLHVPNRVLSAGVRGSHIPSRPGVQCSGYAFTLPRALSASQEGPSPPPGGGSGATAGTGTWQLGSLRQKWSNSGKFPELPTLPEAASWRPAHPGARTDLRWSPGIPWWSTAWRWPPSRASWAAPAAGGPRPARAEWTSKRPPVWGGSPGFPPRCGAALPSRRRPAVRPWPRAAGTSRQAGWPRAAAAPARRTHWCTWLPAASPWTRRDRSRDTLGC
jgi:hypothetical protein